MRFKHIWIFKNMQCLLYPLSYCQNNNYVLCDILQTLLCILDEYFPILDNLVVGLLEWPNFAIANLSLCFLFAQSCQLIRIILKY